MFGRFAGLIRNLVCRQAWQGPQRAWPLLDPGKPVVSMDTYPEDAGYPSTYSVKLVLYGPPASNSQRAHKNVSKASNSCSCHCRRSCRASADPWADARGHAHRESHRGFCQHTCCCNVLWRGASSAGNGTPLLDPGGLRNGYLGRRESRVDILRSRPTQRTVSWFRSAIHVQCAGRFLRHGAVP